MELSRLILGLLSLAPMTGYDIKRHVDSTVRHFWAADKAQVYRALATLVADGYATVEVVPQQGRPDRQEHHITDAGRRALHEWLDAPLPPHTDRDPFLARLFFAGEIGHDGVRRLLAERRVQADELLAALTALETATPRTELGPYLRGATLAYGLTHARAELEWLDDVERNLP